MPFIESFSVCQVVDWLAQKRNSPAKLPNFADVHYLAMAADRTETKLCKELGDICFIRLVILNQ